ncbi:MAG: UDP-N-acetylmuramate:L-alanyl-gamma-D-glutamyl-meso-diaminopimelate ligase [Desulfobulbaceae bacterium]|nr:UDP-N-acetylmuramate:L-alanyl-gamma-D-glutamyl-meso-diaminopimelate ligase [Desulfobulbaceae bacterium]
MAGLDPALNVAPPQVRHVHLMGVCGTGVGALAGMIKAAGFQVSGSDQNVYPPMSDFLAASGITVRSGYHRENLTPRPDLVVVGNVITRDNPEALALAELAIPYLSMPQALAHFFIAERTSLVVTGTHGKTTTSSLLATVLHRAGREPSFLIGGLVQAFGRNFNLGGEQFFVVEGDEYDTAFFDKGPKFLHYRPKVAIITSIEFDHADIYADLEAVKTSFRKLVAIMPSDGCLIAHLDDPVVREIVAAAPCQVLGYGRSLGLDWQLAKVEIGPQYTTFTACKKGTVYGELRSVLPGVHNSLNCLAVTAVLDHLGLTMVEIAEGLASFAGVKRRQEVRGVERGVTVIDDFAHHPTAVRETLAALRGAYPGRRLIAVFDPRTNSSRRRVFQDAFASCFGDADLVLVREPEPLLKVAPEERFSAPELVASLNERGVSGRYFPLTDEIIDYLAGTCQSGDVVAILSNGGFDNIHSRLLARLQG